MFFKEDIEEKITKHENHTRELEILLEMLERESKSLFQELNVLPEQISKFLNDQENFTEKNWNELHEEKRKMEEMLDRSLKNIPNPQKAKKTQAERKAVQPNWLFVR